MSVLSPELLLGRLGWAVGGLAGQGGTERGGGKGKHSKQAILMQPCKRGSHR